jgi:hypothetical protein
MNFEGVAVYDAGLSTKSPAEATPDSDSASTAGIRRISSTLAQTVTADCAERRP